MRSGTLKKLLWALGAVLCAELLWFFAIRPCMPLSKFEIKGMPGVDTKTLLAAAGIGSQSSFMTVNKAQAEAALSALPMVRSAKVRKLFPAGLEISLEPRRAVAVAYVESAGKLVPAFIDGNGMIFSTGKEGYREGEALPVVSGIAIENPAAGAKVSRVYGSLFKQLENIDRESPELLLSVSEIEINRKNYEGYDLTIYPAHTPVKVRLGPDISCETLKYMLLMLDVLSARAEEIEELDFRTGTASYTLKEAFPG
jgi:cell division protein FtsQ